MSDGALRGTRLGTLSYETDDNVTLAERQRVYYDCSCGRTIELPFAMEAEIPPVWLCRCGAEALLRGGERPEPKAERPVRTHWDMLLERRSIEELEELLAERLELLRESRQYTGPAGNGKSSTGSSGPSGQAAGGTRPSQQEQLVREAHRGHLLALGSGGPLPKSAAAATEGILYVFHQDEARGIDVVVAKSLAEAVKHLDSPTYQGEMARRSAYWAYGIKRELIDESPALKRVRSAARLGAPKLVKSPSDWAKIPAGAGVYRIWVSSETGDDPGTVHVGRTSDFKDRPGPRRKHPHIPKNPDGTQKWGVPGGVTKIQLIYAKGEGAPGVWSSVDLDALEEVHIARMTARWEQDPAVWPKPSTQTVGRNGPASQSKTAQYYNWAREVAPPTAGTATEPEDTVETA